MATPRFQHTIQLPQDLEDAWLAYQSVQHDPESFNAFVTRLIQQEMEHPHATL